ncbi:hypothetical protein D9M73_224670 [compost metagenome]
MQRGVQQRDGATGGAARKVMHPPGRLRRGIQAQPGFLDIVFDAEAVPQRLLQQGFGKGGNIQQIAQGLIHGVLRGPVKLDGFFQLAVSGCRRGPVPVGQRQPAGFQRIDTGWRGVQQPGRNRLPDLLVVDAFIEWGDGDRV